MGFNRKTAIRLLSMFIALLMFPGWVELAENAEHLFHDGHLAHSTEHNPSEVSDHPLGNHNEAPCSPADHHCQCCISIPSLKPLMVAHFDKQLATVVAFLPPPYDQRWVTRTVSPPVRPPSA